MNRRNLLIAGVAVLALGSMTAQADRAGPGKRMGDPATHVARMTEHLGLDDNQAATIHAILEQAAQSRAAIGDRYTLNQRAEAAEELKALHETTQAQIAEQLTPEQREQFETAIERRRDRMQFRRLHRRAHDEDGAQASED
ncbi:MAG: hypothetical protein AAGF46_03435 [Pseudomonadota bacterium]